MRDVWVAGEVDGIIEDGGGMSVCEVEELKRHALLVGGHTLRCEEKLDEAGVAWARGR